MPNNLNFQWEIDVEISVGACSAEFRQVIAGKTAPDILEQFSQGILGRPGDSAGVRLYLAEMQRRQYATVLSKLIRSPEFELLMHR